MTLEGNWSVLRELEAPSLFSRNRLSESLRADGGGSLEPRTHTVASLGGEIIGAIGRMHLSRESSPKSQAARSVSPRRFLIQTWHWDSVQLIITVMISPTQSGFTIQRDWKVCAPAFVGCTVSGRPPFQYSTYTTERERSSMRPRLKLRSCVQGSYQAHM